MNAKPISQADLREMFKTHHPYFNEDTMELDPNKSYYNREEMRELVTSHSFRKASLEHGWKVNDDGSMQRASSNELFDIEALGKLEDPRG